MKKPGVKSVCSDMIVMFLAVVMSLNYEIFIFPNAFAPAGINGLSTMVQHVFGISIGYLSLLINVPLFVLAWTKLDLLFVRRSLLFVLVFSCSAVLFDHFQISRFAYCTANGTSAILGPLAAGVINGAIYGVVINQSGSTGGTDILAAWIHKLHPETGLVWVIFSLNATVAVLSFFVYGYQFEPVILCLLYCYLTSSISDAILKGSKSVLKVEVITPYAEELSAMLLQELRHGVTAIPARGMYSGTPKSLLICIINRHQIAHFREILGRFPDTFSYTSNVNETYGNFRCKR